MMNLKKTALASAITLALAGGPVLAATTSVKGAFILDRTEVETGGIVNLALLALNKDEEVDLYGEKGGAVIIAVVTSSIGQVMGGSSSPGEQPGDPVAGGNFAADVKYVKLVQGRGQVHIYYPPETIEGDDEIKVTLQERTANPEGGVNFQDIATTTKIINVKQSGADDPLSLDIIGFKAAAADAMGVTDCHDQSRDSSPEGNQICEEYGPDNGIWGAMTAGMQGGQILVEAGNPYARGNVTVTLRKTNNPMDDNNKPIMGDDCAEDGGCYEYKYDAEMQRGIAIITLDNQVQKAGNYYIEATFDGFEGDSVDMSDADILKVHSTGNPKGIALWSEKGTVAKPGNDFDFSTVTHTQGMGQGTKINAYLLDEYGNATSNGTNSELRIAVQDAQGVFSNTALSLTVPADSMGKIAYAKAADEENSTTDSIVGNALDEILKVGSTSLVAIAVDNQNEPIGSISPSEPLAVKVVADSLQVTPLASFNTSQLAGTEFNAFEVFVTNGEGQVKVDNEGMPIDPGPVVIESSSGEEITVNRKNEAPYHVQALFREATPYGSYLVGDKAGNYGEVEVWVDASNSMNGGILPAAATVVELQNAHGVSQDRVDPDPLTADKKYITGLPESAFKMFDDFGNAITGDQPLTEDDTGTFTVTSSNGTVGYTTPELNRGIPGRKVGMNTYDATITYDTNETPAFAGEDSIQVNFTKPGLGARSLTIKSVVPAVKELDSIKLYLEQAELPVNSTVAMTVEVLDQNGDMLVVENADVKVPITLQINGPEAELGGDLDTVIPAITDLATGKRVNSGQSVDFSDGRKVFVIEAGAKEGQFGITFADAGNPTGLKETKNFTVTKVLEDPCIADPNAEGCVLPGKTEEECDGEGNIWDADKNECTVLPNVGNGDGEEKGTAAVDADGKEVPSNAIIRGGVGVDGAGLQNPAIVHLTKSTDMNFLGSIRFDEDDAGETVDVIGAVTYNFAFPISGAFKYDFNEGALDVWDGDVANLDAYEAEYEIPADNLNYPVPMFEGPFIPKDFVAGTIDIHLGYRMENGTIKFNELPITLDIVK